MKTFRLLPLICLFLFPMKGRAQYNTDHLILNGRSALYYEDYILAIQYFNRVVEARPHLYEPWFYRAIAKFYLDDFTGAEADCSESIRLCPYVENIYELRGLTRIRQNKFKEAIEDYDCAIRMQPHAQNLWLNRTLCRVELKDYAQATLDADTMQQRWEAFAPIYSIRAEIAMQQGDTVKGAEYLDRSLELDPYNAQAWMIRAAISLSREQWAQADEQLSQAIRLKPAAVHNYVNRALARLNRNDLRGAMADYDAAINLDTDNFLAHFNRGLLRVQVGDYNKAIEDFDFIIGCEPDNFLAIYNRATLLHRTGNLRRAIADYSSVIKEFPNFWAGLYQRAECYRKLGLNRQAEADERRVLQAQINKHFSGTQPRWTAEQRRQTRKKSEIDLSKYNQIVVEDDPVVEHEYANSYRGRVQYRNTADAPMPLFALTTRPYDNTLNMSTAFEGTVEAYNRQQHPRRPICVGCNMKPLEQSQSDNLLALIDTLSTLADTDRAHSLRFQRAVVYADVQDYGDALADIDLCLAADSTDALLWWHRAYCQLQHDMATAADGKASDLLLLTPIHDLRRAIALTPDNPYLHYNLGCLLLQQGRTKEASEQFTAALSLNDIIAEAYFNRAVCRHRMGNDGDALNDLSRAGELGLHQAYSMMKNL